MADNSQLKRIDSADFGDDDPFAELTKIMGFDPRVPVRPDAASVPAQPQDASSYAAMRAAPEPEPDLADEDLSIDLEKELLGDFAFDGESPVELAGAPSIAVGEPAFELAVSDDNQFDRDLDVAFAADLEGDLSPGHAEPAIEGRMRELEPAEPALDLDFDAAFAVDLESELLLGSSEQPNIEARAAEPYPVALAGNVDFDAAFERDLALDEEPVDFDEPVRLEGPTYGDSGQAAREEFSDEDVELIAALEPAIMAEQFEEEVPAQAVASRAPIADADNLDFDVAMADVDMDFSADSYADADQGQPDGAGPVRAEAGHAEPFQAGDIDFDGFDDAVFEDDVAPATPKAEAAPLVYVLASQFAEPADAMLDQAAPDVHEAEGLSLEDELNALLGNSVPRAELTRGYDAPPLSASLPEADASSDDDFVELEAELAAWHTEAPAGEDQPEQAFAVESYVPEAAAPIDDVAYAADLSEEDYAGPSYRVAEVERDEDGYRELQQEPVFLGAGVQGSGAEDGLDFDDSAFQVALESSLAADETEEQVVGEDPYASLRQMTSRASAPAGYLSAAPVASVSDWQPATAVVDDDIPDIDTVDVPESAMALADDLDIPELAYEDEARAAPAFDEFEAEFAAGYTDQPQPEETSPRPVDTGNHWQVDRGTGQRYGEVGIADADTGPLYAAGVAAAAGAAYASAARRAERRDFDLDDDFDVADLPGSRKPEALEGFDALDYDELDEEIALPTYAEQRVEPRRRGLLIAAIVGGVAVLGGVGAFALSFGGSGSDVPAIVRADDTPIKVRPENPGGTSVPNQDNKVYETVAGGKGPAVPSQPKLISSAEEPVDMSAEMRAPAPASAADSGPSEVAVPLPDGEIADLPLGDDEIADITAKAEDRVEPSVDTEQPGTDNTEVAAVAPRRVRTMVVRPDGTLVPREDPAPAAAPEPQGAAEAMMETAPAKPAAESQVTNGTKPVFQVPGADPVPVETTAPGKPVKGAEAVASGTPASVPVAPSRPAEQPVEVVGEVKPEQVAAVSQGAAAGAWSMQIASQPSEDAAKSTYQDLARRYASVLGGRGATIVKAEIAGKGTFWRVRVPAGSRNEAISLCESYKSAGGNCFVSK